jgi:SET domain-containing protein
MLLVNASAGPSRIHGQGLIARELIPAGTVIWMLKPGFDVELTTEQFDELAPFVRQQVGKHVYTDMTTGKIVLCSDDAKYMNHADRPNTQTLGQQTAAITDIRPGEELTCDYAEFDANLDADRRDQNTHNEIIRGVAADGNSKAARDKQ